MQRLCDVCGRPNNTHDPELWQCASGLCMDLLHRLAETIGFEFDLFEVADGKWGGKDQVTPRSHATYPSTSTRPPTCLYALTPCVMDTLIDYFSSCLYVQFVSICIHFNHIAPVYSLVLTA